MSTLLPATIISLTILGLFPQFILCQEYESMSIRSLRGTDAVGVVVSVQTESPIYLDTMVIRNKLELKVQLLGINLWKIEDTVQPKSPITLQLRIMYHELEEQNLVTYVFELAVRRPVYLDENGREMVFAYTWDKELFGVARVDSFKKRSMNNIMEMMDMFQNAYLKANQ